jgi:hypothetical protein
MSKTLLQKKLHLKKYLNNARGRARRDNVPFDITYEYLESIATDECPVYGIMFEWGTSNLGRGKTKENCPTLDRILPNKGYVKGNVAFISYKANRIKDNGTMQDHYAIADWIWERINAEQKESTSVPTKHTGESQDNSQLGIVYGAGVGQDCDGAHHHTGEPEGQDLSDSTEAGCRICMGTGVQKMATLATFYGNEGNGDTLCSAEEFAKRIRCVCYQP